MGFILGYSLGSMSGGGGGSDGCSGVCGNAGTGAGAHAIYNAPPDMWPLWIFLAFVAVIVAVVAGLFISGWWRDRNAPPGSPGYYRHHAPSSGFGMSKGGAPSVPYHKLPEWKP